MSYIHTDIYIKQASKKTGTVCGDIVTSFRDENATYIIIADGLGSGIKAHLSAQFWISRIEKLLKSGMSLQKTFALISDHLNEAWGIEKPFAVFSIAKLLANGRTSVMSYEIPRPVFVTSNYAYMVTGRTYYKEKAMIVESNFTVRKGEGFIMFSDGISQAGLGKGLNEGWGIEGVTDYLTRTLSAQPIKADSIAPLVYEQAKKMWRDKLGDDCSVVFAHCRKGIAVNIITGPPANMNDDKAFVEEFLQAKGIKIVCGGSTAKMVAREMNQSLEILEPGDYITPPKFRIKGMSLVTEGAVTLNQVYNLIDEQFENNEKGHPVFELLEMLLDADKIVFWLGTSQNKGNENIEFKRQGILHREVFVKLLADKLIAKNKLVKINIT